MKNSWEVLPQENSAESGDNKGGVYAGENKDRVENPELYKASCFLELAEEAVRNKFISNNEMVEKLLKTIEDAKSKGIDLSRINGFEEITGPHEGCT